MNLDRRLVACVLTFGLITPYMVLPIGFGGIFLNNILLKNLSRQRPWKRRVASQVPMAMLLPAAGMIFRSSDGSVLTYRKPRQYKETSQHGCFNWIKTDQQEAHSSGRYCCSTNGSAIDGFYDHRCTCWFHGIHFRWCNVFERDTRSSPRAYTWWQWSVSSWLQRQVSRQLWSKQVALNLWLKHFSTSIGDNKPLAALLMLVVGLLVTMGIGSRSLRSQSCGNYLRSN